MINKVIQELNTSTPAVRSVSLKRLRPGNVSANNSRQSVRSERTIGQSNHRHTARYVSMATIGSSNAATSEVTDCGALKKIRL